MGDPGYLKWGAFRYAHGRVPENLDGGAWLLVFHSTTFCLVLLSTDEKAHGSDRLAGDLPQ